MWRYIAWQGIEVPSIYFSHRREVVEREGQLMAACEYVPLRDGEASSLRTVRMRTVGDTTCTGCHESTASSVQDIINEIAGMRVTERGSRFDDKRSATAMEDRKREGYF